MKKNYYDEDEDYNEQVEDNDDNYLEMLKGLKEPEDPRKQKKYDFEGSQKYSGTKRKQQPIEEEEEEEITLDEDDNVVEVQKPQVKSNKKKVKSQKNAFSIYGQLNEIDQEDQQIISKTKEDTKGIQETANALKEQFAYWTSLINYRQNLQKVLENVKKLPSQSKEFIGQLDEDNQGLENIVGNTFENIKKLLKNREQLYGIADFDLETEQIEDIGSRNNEQIIDLVQEICSKNKDQIEEDIIKWSQKTTLIGGVQKKQGLTGSLNFGSLLQTPIGQTQKALQNKDKLIIKSQLKRSIFRTLGQGPEDLNKTTSQLIYDDTDFYLELLRDTIIAQPGDGGDMMNQATQSYLLQRRAQNQEKKVKDVDRKASKSRKLRFDTHQKMINFMIPLDNNHEIEARDDIVACLFGGGNLKLVQENTLPKKSLKKSTKKKALNKKTKDQDIVLL